MDMQPIEETSMQRELGYQELRNADYLVSSDKVNLFLTSRGRKPAALLEFWLPRGDFKENDEFFERQIAGGREVLMKLGMPYVEEHSFEDDDRYMMKEWHVFNVGKDEEHLQALLAAKELSAGEGQSGSDAIGNALGYPITAVEAHVNGRSLSQSDYEAYKILEDPAWPFCVFGLSKDHWKEEMEFVRQQAEFIRAEDSRLYDAIVGES